MHQYTGIVHLLMLQWHFRQWFRLLRCVRICTNTLTLRPLTIPVVYWASGAKSIINYIEYKFSKRGDMPTCLCLLSDLDECAPDLKSCLYGETCINGDGSFFCLNITNDKGITIFAFSASYNRLNTRFHT